MAQSGLTQAAADRIALRWYAIPAVALGLVSLAWFLGSGAGLVPITGSVSIAVATLYGSIAAGLVMFAAAYRYGQQRRGVWEGLGWPTKVLDIVTLTVSHLLVAVAVIIMLFVVFTRAFKGLSFDPYTASLLVAASVALISYVLITLALTVTIGQVVAILSIVMIGGVLLAMVTNQQADWWQVNLSYLGTAESVNSLTFNFTLVFSGLMMLALARFVFEAPKRALPSRELNVRVLEGLFVATALALGGVGLFPYTPNTILVQLHNGSATLLVVFIVVMIAGLRWYVPALSREFLATSYLFAAALVVMVWLFQGIGYLSLTAFEITAFGVSFVWLVLLMRNLQLLDEGLISEREPKQIQKTDNKTQKPRSASSTRSVISI